MRSWLISAAVLLGVNLAVTLVVNQHLSAAYLLGPFLAVVASSLYHAERGVGAWGLHLLAVLPVPAILQAFTTVVQETLPAGGPEWASFVMGLGHHGDYRAGARYVDAHSPTDDDQRRR